MTFKEKMLYQQIHPVKLCVDFGTGFFTTYLAWQNKMNWFLILFLGPSVVVTMIVVAFADLERLKNSSFGKHVSQHMTSTIELIRSAGQIAMWVGGWFHIPSVIAMGFLFILGGWLKGKLF